MYMFDQVNKNEGRQSEKGNVLFLILIAVALFAALSYAVTQSTRSGGGDASSETNLVNSSQITQYPASLKTAITRMNVSNSITPDTLLFTAPANFSLLTTSTLQSQAVFYPSVGGGATYQQAPNNVMASGLPGTWHFNAENEVLNIGTDGGASGASIDITTFLPGIKQAICEKINAQLAITGGTNGVMTETATVDTTSDMITTHAGIQTSTAGILGTAATNLVGRPQGCFKLGANYVYYSVLVER